MHAYKTQLFLSLPHFTTSRSFSLLHLLLLFHPKNSQIPLKSSCMCWSPSFPGCRELGRPRIVEGQHVMTWVVQRRWFRSLGCGNQVGNRSNCARMVELCSNSEIGALHVVISMAIVAFGLACCGIEYLVACKLTRHEILYLCAWIASVLGTNCCGNREDAFTLIYYEYCKKLCSILHELL